MERKTCTDGSNLELRETPVWDIGELPVDPTFRSTARKLSFSEYLEFCDEMLRFNNRMGIKQRSDVTPVSEEFVM
jgi:hypothetical protein